MENSFSIDLERIDTFLKNLQTYRLFYENFVRDPWIAVDNSINDRGSRFSTTVVHSARF